MKLRLFIWLGLEFVVAFILGMGSCGIRRDHQRAVRAYLESPSPETAAEKKRQEVISRWHNVGFSSFLFGGMALVTIPIIVSVSPKKALQ